MSKKLKKQENDALTDTFRDPDEVSDEEKIEAIASCQNLKGDFIHLDNAALIFPASETPDLVNMFRVSVILRDPVDPIVLQQALNDVVPRCPSFTAALKHGLFWFYLEPPNKPLRVERQTKFPCRKISADARHALVRVTYYAHEVAAEFFHVASDGNGGLVFMNTLLAAYFKRKGVEITDSTNCLNHLDKPRPEELEDCFVKFADGVTKRRDKDVKAYCIKGKRMPLTALILTKGVMSASALNAAAKAQGMTVTQLIVAALMWAVEKDREFKLLPKKRPVVVNVPVNLRKMHPSATLRNFVSIMPIISNGSTDFKTICARVKDEFTSKNDVQYFKGLINFNIGVQKNPVMKFLPLPLKTLGMKVALKIKSDAVTSTLFSNIGIAAAPKEFADHVVRYEFCLGGQTYTNVAVSAVSYNDNLVVNFSRTIAESDIERIFFRKLAEFVPLCVETNHLLEEGEI